jgi:membrane protein implicated in regulation of membrane protease activity
MNTLIKADFFFFITTISIVLLTIVAIVVAFYVIRILRNVKELSEKVKIEGGEIIDDVSVARKNIKKEGSSIWLIIKKFLRVKKSKK